MINVNNYTSKTFFFQKSQNKKYRICIIWISKFVCLSLRGRKKLKITKNMVIRLKHQNN